MMQAIVIGGAAHGMIIQSMRADATRIELRRPDYIKPLASPGQQHIETEDIFDEYEVCTIFLTGDNPEVPVPFGLVIESGKTVVWAMSELVKGFAQNVADLIAQRNRLQ